MRVAIAMSGGVDSSVAAALLAEEGHEVVGITLKVWDESRCCSLKDSDDARAVARKLGIPHFTIDAREAFEEWVISPFLGAYSNALTPNPCVLCNRKLKFGWMLQRVRQLGCEQLATGHYARIVETPHGGRELHRGLDHSKDQAYFVVPESREVLNSLLFPLGGFDKARIREMARERGLPTAGKPDSQDLCFVPKGGMREYLAQRVDARPGKIVDTEGKVLGTHQGLHLYTLGQRKGMGIASSAPLHVVGKSAGENLLVLGPREALFTREFTASGATWLADHCEGNTYLVRTRSTGPLTPCTIAVEGDKVFVTLAEPQFSITPGQFAVFFDGEKVVGAGWIVER